MVPPALLFNVIDGALGSVLLLSLAIIIGTLILEDPTVIIVGVLASDGTISMLLALASLYAGVILGDIAFYALGRLAGTHPRLARYIDHDYVVPLRTWLETRYVLAIFTARFIPGSRLPTFAASGFLRSPFITFISTAVLATAIWTTVLFFISYWYGSATAAWLQEERWAIALAVVLLVLVFGHRNLLRLWKKQEAA